MKLKSAFYNISISLICNIHILILHLMTFDNFLMLEMFHNSVCFIFYTDGKNKYNLYVAYLVYL